MFSKPSIKCINTFRSLHHVDAVVDDGDAVFDGDAVVDGSAVVVIDGDATNVATVGVVFKFVVAGSVVECWRECMRLSSWLQLEEGEGSRA